MTSVSFFFLGSGPDRGRSPVEWGDFPSVRPAINQRGLTAGQRGSEEQLERFEGNSED